MVNPDGVNLVQNGPGASLHPEALMAMRCGTGNLEVSQAEGKYTRVDLNRNFENNWDVARPVNGAGIAPL
jgi:hypothetical protein